LLFSARSSRTPGVRGLFRGIAPLAACLLFGAVSAVAQTYNVLGTVLDDSRNTPIAGVDIRMADGRPLGVSTASGRFEITVNSRQAVLVFRREGYRDTEVSLADFTTLVDIDILMESNVQELDERTTYTRRPGLNPSDAQTIEELEALQGMRMDLNDHLRQMHGVAGMNEYTSDISVHGSRTQDVTHYLGRSRIPSLRHLDFGFPGNQSVLNPRLLRAVTLADNPAKGPLNQGNASALVYDLKNGDPEAIHADAVLGSTNREFNATGYWGERTFTTSARYLDPNSLSALGSQFFTSPKEARLGSDQCGGPNQPSCGKLNKPLEFNSLDLFFSTFKRDTTGKFSRHTFIILDDDYVVQEDKSPDPTRARGQRLIEGFQGAFLYSYEKLTPTENGEWEWGFSFLRRGFNDAYRDTLMPLIASEGDDPTAAPRWYPRDGSDVQYRLGDSKRLDYQTILSGTYSSNSTTFGALPSYGVEIEYFTQNREYRNISSGVPASQAINELDRSFVLGTGSYRLRWNLGNRRVLEGSAGAAWAYANWRAEGERSSLSPMPHGSMRYTQTVTGRQRVYGEVAGRHSVALEPTGFNEIAPKATPSVELKVGGDGFITNPLRYAWSGYTRAYKDPTLPIPEVFWNYEETREAKHALVNGGNLTLNYLPGHHVGMGLNASIIQGTYHLKDGGTLPWESNRTLDLVYNLRYLPRDDSLFSFIITYGIQNEAPLYQYDSLWAGDPVTGASTGRRYVRQNSQFPTVSRQRVDARMNLDLKADLPPLQTVRFFFEADNIFSGFDDAWASWLGGRNERKRGWTRAEDGNLKPVVTGGLGLFIMFGIEAKLRI
jgi:hypothetical protein